MSGVNGRALAADSIRHDYGGVRALDGVSVEVATGTVHGLIGPNGSGKTTFFDIVCGFVRQSGGRLEVLGLDMSRMAPVRRVRRGIGRTFQLPNVLHENTVLENVLLGVVAGVPARRRLRALEAGGEGAAQRRALDALDAVELTPLAHAPLRDLPYGSQRIVDLARVLAARPSLVLLDEPAAGMSGSDREVIKRNIVRLRAEGATVMVVEHDMRFIMEICDRITVLSAGVVIAEGPPAVVGRDEAVIQAYLGEAYAEG
jgi:ABC-type branched-subunit amino acid transport system ATPase component